MMNRITVPLIVGGGICCTLALAHSFSFDISVADLTFTFSKPLDAPPHGKRHTVSLNEFLVVRKKNGTWVYEDTMWRFHLPPGTYIEVEEVRYGIVPQGFQEMIAAKPLAKGTKYFAVAYGAGSSGEKEFTAEAAQSADGILKMKASP
jgi:hypothetical protein